MRVDEVMSSAQCCEPDDTVRDCAQLMKQANIGFVPICDDSGKPVGTITDRDLAIRVLADGQSSDAKLERFMSHDVVGCRLGDDLQDAERLMRERQVSRIMVCDEDGKLRGVISLHDLVEREGDVPTARVLGDVKSDQQASIH
jgi:CBS domain-containing protein